MLNQGLSRRHFLRLTGGALGVAALVACAPAPGGQAGAPAAESSGAITVAADTPLWVLQKQDFHPNYNDFVRKHIEDFAKERGYSLEIADMAGFVAGGAEIQKVAAQVAADDSPDVMHRDGDIFQWKQLDLVLPVTEIVKELIDAHGDIPARQKKDLQVDGDFYAVPFHTRSDGGWARKDIWDAKGIDVTKLRTYDELRDACLEVTDPSKEIWSWGITVNRSGDGGYMVSRILNAMGAFWTDETGQFVTIDTPEAVAAVEWLADLYTNPKWEPMLPPGVLSWTDPSNNEAYLGGKVSYTQNGGTVYAKAVADKNPVADVTIWDEPKGGPGLAKFDGKNSMNFHIIKGAKNPEAAAELIKSFFTEEAMKAAYVAATSYALPAYEKHWEWAEIANVTNSVAQKSSILDPSGWNGLAYPGPGTAWMGAVGSQNLHTDMIAAVLNGQASAAEAVKQAAEASIKLFQEMGATGTK